MSCSPELVHPEPAILLASACTQLTGQHQYTPFVFTGRDRSQKDHSFPPPEWKYNVQAHPADFHSRVGGSDYTYILTVILCPQAPSSKGSFWGLLFRTVSISNIELLTSYLTCYCNASWDITLGYALACTKRDIGMRHKHEFPSELEGTWTHWGFPNHPPYPDATEIQSHCTGGA